MTSNTHYPTLARVGRAGLALLVALAVLAASPAPFARAQGGEVPTSLRLNGFIHTYQEWNNCGPANLTMALSYFGWREPQGTAASFLKPNPEDKNVAPAEMVTFVNERQNAVAVGALWRYGGNMELIKRAMAAGFPVVIESGYDVEDLDWMGHYETVVAFDDASQTVWVYDSYLGIGNEGLGLRHSYAEFDSYWRHFNRSWLILFPLDQSDKVREVLGPYADPTYAATQALTTAKNEAALNPTDGWAWFNAGTSSVKLGRFHDAAIYFDEAFRHGLPYRLMWYMYGPYEAYYNIGRYQDVLDLADNTESTTPYVEEIYYWRGMALAALGRFNEAVIQLDRAIAFNPYYTPAATARSLIQSGQYTAPAAPVS